LTFQVPKRTIEIDHTEEGTLTSLRSFVIWGLIVTILSASSPAYSAADKTKEFTTSCIYGVLAGTLVGAATLAFTSKPGDNLNNVARGASYGLYTGILLGLYVTYGVPNDQEGDQGPGDEGAPASPDGTNPDEGAQRKNETTRKIASSGSQTRVRFFDQIMPILPTSVNVTQWGGIARVLDVQF